MNTFVLAASSVVTDSRVSSPGWLRISGSRIVACGDGEPPRSAAEPPVERVEGIVVPGFVDIHSHGAAGVEFGSASAEEMDRALQWLRAEGTTTVVASVATAPLEALDRKVAVLSDHVRDGKLGGIHLEGPWLSHEHRGSHAASLLRSPRLEDVKRLVRAEDGVRMVTLAPELSGGLVAIREIVEGGVVAAIGHTNCDSATARSAFDTGATVATHLFNGMPSLHHRAPGPVAAAILDDRVSLELILDNHHLSRDAVQLVLSAAGDRVIAISDSIAATGADDGTYDLAGSCVEVRDGVARTTETGSLAGSTITLARAFRTLVRNHGLSLSEAVGATSTRPARVLGLEDVGTLHPGSRADLLVLSELAVTAVMKDGVWFRR